jgi:hypothetical protein
MSESLLRLVHAIRNAKLAIDNVLRMQYKAAGYPFGESEEGLILWREKLAKDYALFHEKAAPSEFPGHVFGGHHKDSRYVLEHFSSLGEEVQKRIN